MPKRKTNTKQPSRRKTSLTELHTLCDKLNDRDEQLKRDVQLFEDFFSNFPIPVMTWSIDASNRVLSVRGNSIIDSSATVLDEMFGKHEGITTLSLTKHAEALKGDIVSYFIEGNEKTYWVKLVPRKHVDDTVLGVVGIAWDITSNAIMLDSLEKVVSEAKSGRDLKKIRAAAEKAIGASRLKTLLENEGVVE